MGLSQSYRIAVIRFSDLGTVMNLKNVMMLTFAAWTIIGCSGKQVYEGIQAGNRGQCEKYVEPERTKCLEATNKSFEQYQRERGKEKS